MAHLNDLGLLGPEFSCAHAVWLTDQDLELLAQNRTTVCHNASSNLRLKNRVAPVNRMIEAGINVAMGTDSTVINDDDGMLQEMRLVSKLHRQLGAGTPDLTSQSTLGMANINGGRPTFFHQEIGTLELDHRADAVLPDLKSIQEPYLDPDIDPVDGLLYRGKAGQVDTVSAGGEVMLRNGRYTKIDKEEILQQLKHQYSYSLELQVQTARALVKGLLPHV